MRLDRVLPVGLVITLVFGSPALLASYRFHNGLRDNQFNATAGITLNKDIHASRGARVYIQKGEVVSKPRESDPYCYFWLYRSSNDLALPVDIQAATFQVGKIRSLRQNVRLQPPTTDVIQLAAIFSGFMGNGGTSHFTFATEIGLSDPAQPAVFKLVCAIWADPVDRRFLNLDEIIQTLGELVTIQENQ
jgi:hypothetical protein